MSYSITVVVFRNFQIYTFRDLWIKHVIISATWKYTVQFPTVLFPTSFVFSPLPTAREENVATFRGSEYFCYDLSQNPIQSSSDEITLSFKTWQRNGLILHTGKSADYVNLALKDGAVSLVINLGSGAFEAIVEPVTGKFNDNSWHDVKVTRNLRQVRHALYNWKILSTVYYYYYYYVVYTH